MSKFGRSWMLFRRSLQVVGRNKKLLLFPVVVALLTGLVALFFLASIGLWGTGYGYTTAAHWQAVAHRWFAWEPATKTVHASPAGCVLLVALYLVSMFLATFFNVAFYNEILKALKGQPVSIRGGLAFALTRWKAIAAWSLLSGVVGLIIKTLEERVGLIGRWIVRLVGVAWSVASVFVVPVIVREGAVATPVRFLKTSAGLLKRTWGESLIGYLGVQFGGLLVLAGSLVLLGASVYASIRLDNYWILGTALTVWAVGLVAFLYLLHVASQIYLGALYLYASEGAPPAPFEPEQMNLAWRVRRDRQS